MVGVWGIEATPGLDNDAMVSTGKTIGQLQCEGLRVLKLKRRSTTA
jgi:hypothetical protein